MPWRGSIPLPPARRKLDARRAWQLTGIFALGALQVLVALLWWRLKLTPARWPATALLAAFVLQAMLGVSTQLLGVPVILAAAHQAGAVLLFAAALWTAHEQ